MLGGIYCYDRNNGEWKHYTSSDDKPLLNALCLTLDRTGRLWAGTGGNGVFMYDREKDGFIRKFDVYNGLLNDVVYSLVTDRTGALWGSTNKGLFRIDVESFSVVCYTKQNGLLSDQFNYKSGFLADDGKMFFGGITGFVSFYPENLPKSSSRGRVVLNSLQVNNSEVKVRDKDVPLLDRSIMETSELVIPYSISAFTIGVTEINYSPSMNSDWLCCLEGWDRIWLPLGLPGRVTYSNLPPGTYRFKIKGGDTSFDEELVSLKIIVRPPFWRSLPAFFIYAFLLSCILASVICFIRKRMTEEDRRRRERINEMKEKEIYEAKIGFFANMTHELRTPLSLIKLPLNEIISRTGTSSPEYRNLLTIRANADRLLDLLNQLLDFRKLNLQTDKPCFIHSDVADVVRRTISRFVPSAKIRGIEIIADIPQHLSADADVEMFTKITSNLLNNAMKHSRSFVKVELSQEADTFSMIVSNDGDRIPPEASHKIFTPFFKLDDSSDGFGVGLSLVRSLCELHSGSVSYFEDKDNLTCFEVVLPSVQAGSFNMDKGEEDTGPGPKKDERVLDEGKKVILVVDNDVSFLDYVSRLLDERFQVLKASSGELALEMISETNVDVVISDIVMPGLDGLGLCSRIKEDVRYRKIPVILVSSEAAARSSRVDAMQAGADLVVEKPFRLEWLVAGIDNLIKTEYISSIQPDDEESDFGIIYTKADDGFVKMLVGIIENNLEDVDLDTSRLASMLNMSRATLYRKVSEVLNVTPNDFIRIIRLKRAAELLRRKEYRVSEISYIVGFRSSSYFSKCFSKYYGVLPKDFK